MSERAEKLYDVVLSHAPVDVVVAEAVRRTVEAAGLSVFMSTGAGTGSETATAVRRAIQESMAFAVLLAPSHARSTTLSLEVGAAWVWSTPTYLLLSDMNTSEVPPYLGRDPALLLWAGVQGGCVRPRERPTRSRGLLRGLGLRLVLPAAV